MHLFVIAYLRQAFDDLQDIVDIQTGKSSILSLIYAYYVYVYTGWSDENVTPTSMIKT